ncbi:MAG: ATP-binding cassette domain-containing protein [Gammaproteobacteria bacterium]|nr:ATP-binding cassette domain-containing protein [Gammaproteobacteria bacterium]MBA3731416.1 ATP-binding cassette domain-containing protein [Gammaproteobacteria bacterium]
MFELAGVTRRYGESVALARIDLSIEKARTTILIGPSGSGKSTLLRLLVRLIAPDTGTVYFEDQPLTDDNAAVLRRRMGFVVQEGGLFPHLSAHDNVALMARYLRWEGARIEARIGELSALTHFPTDGLKRFPVELSGGQRQRVSLMRALMLDPGVLLLDEPLGALDPMIRFDLQNELRDIFRGLKKTVVMVTHDLSEAGFFADTIVLLREGRIVQRGSLTELLRAPADAFVEQFIRAQRSSIV